MLECCQSSCIMATPVGNMYLAEINGYITKCYFTDKLVSEIIVGSALEDACYQFDQYFSGKLFEFKLPIKLYGTEFQQRVWNSLLDIPYSKTVSYKDIAIKINHEKAVRAVGSAIGKNPICILIPCHRVVRSSGGLGGYAGGIDKKKFLLNLEVDDV